MIKKTSNKKISNSQLIILTISLSIFPLILTLKNSNNKIPLIILSTIFLRGIIIIIAISITSTNSRYNKSKKNKKTTIIIILLITTISSINIKSTNQISIIIFLKQNSILIIIRISTTIILILKCIKDIKNNFSTIKSSN